MEPLRVVDIPDESIKKVLVVQVREKRIFVLLRNPELQVIHSFCVRLGPCNF